MSVPVLETEHLAHEQAEKRAKTLSTPDGASEGSTAADLAKRGQ